MTDSDGWSAPSAAEDAARAWVYAGRPDEDLHEAARAAREAAGHTRERTRRVLARSGELRATSARLAQRVSALCRARGSAALDGGERPTG